jgi:hypothetical protein
MTLMTLHNILCFFSFISLMFLYACLRKLELRWVKEISIGPHTGSVVAVVIMHQAHINPSSLGLMLIIPYQSIITPAFLSFNKGGNHGSVIICRIGEWSS